MTKFFFSSFSNHNNIRNIKQKKSNKMGAQNSTKSQNQFYKLKADKANKTELRFYKQEKVDGSWGETEKYNNITGYLKDIKVTQYEYQGEQKDSIEIYLKDNESDNTIVINSGFSNIARGLLNCLAGVESFGVISLQCGLSKDKQHPALYVKNDDKNCDWKYSWDSIPKVEEILVKNKKYYDSTAVDAFFKKVIIDDIIPNIKGLPIEAIIPELPAMSDAAKAKKKAVDNKPVEDDGLPF